MSDLVSRQNKAEEAYQIIKEKIVTFEYLPGTPVTELYLCEQLNMSRTPVKIAIAKLTSEGFITELGPKKSIIADISVDAFINIYQVREALDLLSGRSACYKWQDKSEIDEIRKMLEEQKEVAQMEQVDSRLFLKMDLAFHRKIVDITRNSLLCKEISYIYDLYWRYNFYSMHVTGVRSTVAEHERILDAIERRDVTLCTEQITQHLQTVKEHTLVGIAKGFSPVDMNKAKAGYVFR